MGGDRLLFVRRVVLSLAVSLALVLLLLHLAGRAGSAPGLGGLAGTLRNLSLPLAGAYLVAQVVALLLRAERYRVLLRGAGEPRVPGLLPLCFVTAARNMFVDMVPARAGELSYVALLNRRYGVQVRSCVSSLGVAVFLDFAALLAVLAAIFALAPTGAGVRGGLGAKAALLVALVAVLAVGLFAGIRFVVRLLRSLPQSLRERRLVLSAGSFLGSVADDIDTMRASGAMPRALLLSLGLRVFKYAGLYAAFLAVTIPSFRQLAGAPVREVIAALIAGEGAAGLPVPTFMSFGTYEAGALAAFVGFGFPAAQTVLALLALHLVSQAVDYTLGGLGLIGVIVHGGDTDRAASSCRLRRQIATIVAVGALALAVIGASLWHQRQKRLRGLSSAPPRGQVAPAQPGLEGRLAAVLGTRRGFVVFSSNRHGTHDILRMELPAGTVTRLTRDPHTDTMPRISPDGQTVAFSRSQIPWVSQRNPVPWDAWTVDAAGGTERFVARGANRPTWSFDGGTLYFQRNGGEFVSRRISTGQERTLFRAGVPPVPEGVVLETPEYDETAGRLLATLRGGSAPRITALFTRTAPMQKIGGRGDCQLAFAPDGAFLFVGQGGRQKNAIYTTGPGREPELLLDLPGDLSHEYFPRQSADGRYLVFAASAGGRDHEHDAGDYELFLWRVGDPAGEAVRLTYHTGNDSWPDIWLLPE